MRTLDRARRAALERLFKRSRALYSADASSLPFTGAQAHCLCHASRQGSRRADDAVPVQAVIDTCLPTGANPAACLMSSRCPKGV